MKKRAKFTNFSKARMRNGILRCGSNYKNVLDRDKYVCAICGFAYNVVVHHLDGNVQHNTLDNLLTVCKACHAELYGYNSKFNNPYIKIITKLRNQNKTYQEIGNFLGVSRQRILQLIKKHGSSMKEELIEIPHPKQGFLRIESKCINCGKKIYIVPNRKTELLCKKCHFRKMAGYKQYFICKGCGKEVDKDKDKGLINFCKDCHKIFLLNRDPKTTLNCLRCGKSFHPFRNWRCAGKPKYCSINCFHNKN